MSDLPKLTIKYDTRQPLEATDFTASLNALVRQYQKFAVTFDDVSSRKEAVLYVQDLRKGSTIVDLVPSIQEIGAAVQGFAPYTEDAKKVLGFAKYLKTGMDKLLGGKKAPEDIAPKDLKDFNQILEPVAKDPGAKFVFQATDGAVQNITINYNSQESNAIQNQAIRQIEAAKEPEQQRFNKRLMYWYAATRGKPSKSSDKAIIETISKKPLPVFIEDPEVKQQMMEGRENPFVVGFYVDVELLLLRGEVRGYNIVKLHGIIEDEETVELEDPDESLN